MVWFGDGQRQLDASSRTATSATAASRSATSNNDGVMDVGYAMHHDYSSNDFGDQLIEVALRRRHRARSGIPWDDGLATNGETYGMFGTDFADVEQRRRCSMSASNSFGCCAGVHVYLQPWRRHMGAELRLPRRQLH